MRLYQCFLVSVAALAVAACGTTLDATRMPELQAARKAQRPIFVGNLFAGKADKRGFIDAGAHIFNTSGKTYKYVDLHLTATNRVGDPIVRNGEQSPMVRLRFTGPLPPRRASGRTTWPNVWYLQKPACLTVLKIDITRMDGSTVSLDGAALDDVLSKKLRQDCRVKLTALRR